MAGPLGCWRQVQQWPPPKLETSMAGPLGCWRQVRQRPPPKLEMSMAVPLGVLAAGPAAATTEVGDVDGGPLGPLALRYVVSSAKKMLVVTSDPGGAGSELPLLALIHRPHS
jgi:hypothetical protein